MFEIIVWLITNTGKYILLCFKTASLHWRGGDGSRVNGIMHHVQQKLCHYIFVCNFAKELW